MPNFRKKKAFGRTVSLLLICLAFTMVVVNCNKSEDTAQRDIREIVEQDDSDHGIMNPGPDPVFVKQTETLQANMRTAPMATAIQWERYMYIDRTDTVYNNTASSRRLAGYLRKYGFTGVYLYGTSGIIGMNSNFVNFATFNKTLSDSGITYRAVVSGSAGTFGTTGRVTAYNNSRTDVSEKINRANLELEWWNNATTWSSWNSTNQQVSMGTVADNDFYEGWYKNLGTTIDTMASKDQVRFSDRILLHCYQLGIPTYSYANAQSAGSTGGRLDIMAKGARQAGRKIDLYIIISSENTAWGASNTFTGPALQNAYASGQPNPYWYVENQAWTSINGGMTPFQKTWINLKGFVWFTKRYCYRAVPPM